MAINVTVPNSLEFEDLITFTNELESLPLTSHYIFNFKHMSWVPPFGLLYLGNYLKKYREERPDAYFQAVDYELNNYAAHMGFYKAFGLAYGKDPGEASGSSSYLPIRFLMFDEIRQYSAFEGIMEQDMIEGHADEISKVLARSSDGPLVETLSFCFREILRNSIEHSEGEKVGYCAQYWPSKHRVEVAIMDTGIGISNSMKRNPHLSISCDKDALNYSLLPGVSCRSFSGNRIKTHDVWGNSGFGLYMTSRLCGNGGSFFISSGMEALLLEDECKTNMRFNHSGTILRLIIDTSKINPLSCSLDMYKKEGEQIAKSLGIGANITASKASSMVSSGLSKRKLTTV